MGSRIHPVETSLGCAGAAQAASQLLFAKVVFRGRLLKTDVEREQG